MPRYTSFQLYGDRDAKVVSGYTEKGPEGAGGGKSKVTGAEKVENVSGSNAGASSAEFHKYLSARNREKARLENIEEKLKAEELSLSLQQKVEMNRREADERTQKNAAKRKRKKERAAIAKKSYKAGANTADALCGENIASSSAETVVVTETSEIRSISHVDEDNADDRQREIKKIKMTCSSAAITDAAHDGFN